MEQSTATKLSAQPNQSIMLPISKNYVEHWGLWEAVREFIQNAVDVDSSARVTIFHDELKIDSIGEIQPQSLLLGESTKRGDNSTIGKYGEGYKLALLVLTRMGYEVNIATGEQIWTPVFREHPQLGTECLHIDFSDRPKSVFTTVTVRGLKPEDAAEISDKYLPLRTDYEVVAEAKGKQVLDDTGGTYDEYHDVQPTKNIFIKGLWVCALPTEDFWFSYNLTPDAIELDRDRGSVDTWDLQYQATKLLTEAGEAQLLAQMAEAGATDISSCFESIIKGSGHYGGVGFAQQIADMAERDFVEKYGTKAYPMDKNWAAGKFLHYSRLADQMGLTPVVLDTKVYAMLSKAFREGIVEQTNPEYETIYKKLDAILLENKKHMRSKPFKALSKLLANTMLRGV